jgi:outer membrane protein assembly factor BamA
MVNTSLRVLIFLKLLMIPFIGYGQQLFILEEKVKDGNIITSAVSAENIDYNEFLTSLIRSFSDEGYFQFQIDSLIIHDIAHIAFYSKGNRTIMREIVFNSNIDSTKTVLNRYYSTFYLESMILDRVKSFQNRGYPFVQSSIVEIISIGTDSVDVHIDFETGPTVDINGLTFRGNKQLSSSYLQKISGFESSKLYSDAVISNYSNNLRKSQFLNDVGEVNLIAIHDQYKLQFEIVEIRPSFLDIIVGYDPAARGGDQLIGNGRLILNNLLFEGSIARLEFNKLPGTETRLQMNYHQKWFNNWPVNSTLGLDFHQRDSTYYQISSRMDVSYMINRRFSPGLFLIYNTVETSRINQSTEHLDSKAISYGFSFTYENLDRYYVPKRGSVFFIELGNKFKSILNIPKEYLLSSSNTSQFIEFSLRNYIQLSNHFVLSQKLTGGASNHSVYFEDDLFRLGGTNSIRGYREEQFKTSNFLWGDLEIRRLLDDFSYLFFFASMGLEQSPDQLGVLNAKYTSSLIYSGGLGLSYKIQLGFLKLSYALSPEDRLNNGKVHFGISNSF